MNYPPYRPPMQPIVTIGFNTYPDGVVHVLPYTFGVRAPYPSTVSPDSEQGQVNRGFALGAETAAFRVGAAGLITGFVAGMLGLLLYQRVTRKRS
jgi:hypothetical protein